MPDKKKSKKASSDQPSVKVRDLEPDQAPQGGATLPSRSAKWELSEYDAVLNPTIKPGG